MVRSRLSTLGSPFVGIRARIRSRALDRRLAAGERAAGDRGLAARARVLASPGSRECLARSLREIVSLAECPPAGRPKAPVARADVLGAAADLRLLASRLQAPMRVDPRGVAEVRLLISDGNGPLYNHGSGRSLHAEAVAARASLGPVEAARRSGGGGRRP